MKDKVVQVGDPVLRQRAKAVAKKDIGSRKVQGLIKRMRDVLAHEEFGVAIAAPQVNESLRIFVIAGKVFAKPAENSAPPGGPGRSRPEAAVPPDKVFINPVITKLSKKKVEMTEGCLSVRHKYGAVMRHERATVRAQDEHGNPFVYNGSGLLGHIFQHEADHLDGVLYTDKAVKVEEDENWEKLGKARRASAR